MNENKQRRFSDGELEALLSCLGIFLFSIPMLASANLSQPIALFARLFFFWALIIFLNFLRDRNAR